jgi:hypothetical protein
MRQGAWSLLFVLRHCIGDSHPKMRRPQRLPKFSDDVEDLMLASPVVLLCIRAVAT